MNRMIAIISFMLLSMQVFCCTTIDMSSSDRQVVAKNLDWPNRVGVFVVHPRHLNYRATTSDNPAQWQSKYGSVILHGQNDDTIGPASDGMNEMGLQVSVMNLKTSVFSHNADKNVNMGLWSQYILDNFQSVDEVLAHINDVNVTKETYQGQTIAFHLYIHDINGHRAIIEYNHGGLIIYKDDNLLIPVLTNSFYQNSLDELSSYRVFGGDKPLPGEYDSLSRFIRGAAFKKKLPLFNEHDRIGYAFDGLAAVAQPPGSYSTTQISTVFDINNKTLYYRTVNNPNIYTINLNDYDFNTLDNPIYIDVFSLGQFLAVA